MIKINKQKFEVKSCETTIREREYENKSYITLNIITEFYPELYNDSIIYGTAELKIDLSDIHALNDLEGKKYTKDIGTINVSVNNNNIWEQNSYNDFEIEFGQRKGRKIEIKVSAEDFELKTKTTISSLYTTSTKLENLKKNFDLSDFYEITTNKEIGKSNIIKFYTKK